MRIKFKCDNCRVRKVKCDQVQPPCSPCQRLGLVCGYNATMPTMSSTIDTVLTLDLKSALSKSQISTDSSQIGWMPNHLASWPVLSSMKPCDLDRLGRFCTRTASTISVNLTSIPAPDDLICYATTRGHLMHAILAVTAIHDEHLSIQSNHIAEAKPYHLKQAAHFLNRRLSMPVDELELNLICASSLLLHRAVLAAIDYHEPHQAWPNRSRGSVDLDWFRFVAKARMFTMDLDRSQHLSEYSSTQAKSTNVTPTTPTRTMQVQSVIELLGMMCMKLTSPGDTCDPRYVLFRALAPMILQPDHANASMAQLSPIFKALDESFVNFLDRKDPVSLLLLGILNAHLCSRDWWVARRARVEGKAICLYLENHHGNIQSIVDCLWYPKLLLESVS